MFKSISKFINSHSISQLFNLGGKNVAWKKVRELKAGMKIAVASTRHCEELATRQSIQMDPDSGVGMTEKVEWDEIVSIRKVGSERVWDIEVEGTHNFVGNGIIAHNTGGILMRAGASSLQLSSSATSTTADIELAAADQIDLFAGRFSLTTSSSTAGDIKIDSAGTLTLSTSRNNTNINILTGSGKIGINMTAAPSYTLDVSGSGRFSCASDFANVSHSTFCSDIAETYETSDPTVEAGDVLAIDYSTSSGQVAKSQIEYDPKTIGVYSFSPGLLVGGETILGAGTQTPQEGKIPVALAGRVPVKIDPNSEPIAAGDFLTSSASPGLAKKATQAGYTIGKALESWSPTSKDERIMVFVNLSYYMGPMTADGYIDTGLKLKVADVVIDPSSGSSRGSETTVGISPDGIATSSSTPRNDDLDSLQTRVTQLEDLVAIMAFDKSTLESQQRPGLTSQGQALSELTLSGSYMNSEVNLGSKLVSPLPEPKLTLTTSQELPAFSSDSSGYSSVLGSLTIGGSLTVGTTLIGEDGSINGLGCSVIPADAGIYSDIDSGSGAGMTKGCASLRFQPLALGNIEFMAGKIVMTKNGDMKVTGSLTVNGDLIVGGTVAGTKIEILEQPENTATDSAQPSTASIGEAVIPAGASEVTIYSTAVGVNSKVFVTADQPAAIGARVNGKGQFTIELAQPETSQLKVNWWVVN